MFWLTTYLNCLLHFVDLQLQTIQSLLILLYLHPSRVDCDLAREFVHKGSESSFLSSELWKNSQFYLDVLEKVQHEKEREKQCHGFPPIVHQGRRCNRFTPHSVSHLIPNFEFLIHFRGKTLYFPTAKT